jgi:GNAT superfamily N-acetyltransferase
MGQITIRPALTSEADALSALCFRSKAYWGYDDDFMERVRGELTITPQQIETGRVLAAVGEDGRLLGMASVAPLPQEGEYDLVHMFVDVGVMNIGAGRALFFAAAARARAKGATRLVIAAEPNAVEFYRRMGALDAGQVPSDSLPGRLLPLLHYELG